KQGGFKRDRYNELVAAFPLRPIRSHEAHQQAKRVFRSLHSDRSREASDYRHVLLSLIVEYEEQAGCRVETAHIAPAELVRHLLNEHKMSVNAFAREIAISQSSLSEMLNGRRDWSKSVIVKVS